MLCSPSLWHILSLIYTVSQVCSVFVSLYSPAVIVHIFQSLCQIAQSDLFCCLYLPMTVAKSCYISWGLHVETVPLAGIKALLISLGSPRKTRALLSGGRGFLSSPLTLSLQSHPLSQLQGLECRGVFSLNPPAGRWHRVAPR